MWMVGSDSDFMYFVSPSQTRWDVNHELRIDKRTGQIICGCEDALYRVIRPDLLKMLAGEPQKACKHAELLVWAHKEMQKRNG
jgi:hypothetical protein